MPVITFEEVYEVFCYIGGAVIIWWLACVAQELLDDIMR